MFPLRRFFAVFRVEPGHIQYQHRCAADCWQKFQQLFQLIFPQTVGVQIMHLDAVIGRKHGELACCIFQRFQLQLLPVEPGQRHVCIAAGPLFQQAGGQLFYLHQVSAVDVV